MFFFIKSSSAFYPRTKQLRFIINLKRFMSALPPLHATPWIKLYIHRRRERNNIYRKKLFPCIIPRVISELSSLFPPPSRQYQDISWEIFGPFLHFYHRPPPPHCFSLNFFPLLGVFLFYVSSAFRLKEILTNG